jgi:hypothetical protein
MEKHTAVFQSRKTKARAAAISPKIRKKGGTLLKHSRRAVSFV